MSGSSPSPAPVTGTVFNGTDVSNTDSDRLLNLFRNSNRISAAIDRLKIHFRSHLQNDTVMLSNLCLSLSRSIDFSITYEDVPSRAQELPPLLKQLCQLQDDPDLLAKIMLLMISVKNACQIGWFSERDNEELINLTTEIASNFCDVSDFNSEPSRSISVISEIMSRFYPRMKMGHILVSLEIKPGSEAYIRDFQITKNLKSSPGEKIRLFVVQTDNIETSSCLISPPKVSFLLNGYGIENRNNLIMDSGPQIPTALSNLKYGSNLLQAVGEFNGNYVVAVAFMSEIQNPECNNALQDYKQQSLSTLESDSDIVEGPSRVSLNCPISFKRIKTPVKGHSCKHNQCFDFDNYVDINSRRPSWRCPHCNQHVCFTDIRIDQKMAKILNEVGTNVNGVTLSSDGSWSPEIDDPAPKPQDKHPDTEKEKSPQPESDGLPNVMDLTSTDDAMDFVFAQETGDRKVNPIESQSQPMSQNGESQIPGDDFWSGLDFSTFGAGSSIGQPNGEAEAFNSSNNSRVTPVSENDTLQLQQYQFGNQNTTSNEYGRFGSLPRNVTRTPLAVQALPAQNNFGPDGLSVQVSQISSSPLHQYPGGVRQNRPLAVSPRVSQPNQFSSAYRVSNERQIPTQPIVSNLRMPPPHANFVRPQNPIGVSQAGAVSHQQANLIVAANRMVQMATSRPLMSYSTNPNRHSVGGDQGNIGISSQSIPRTDARHSVGDQGGNFGISSQPDPRPDSYNLDDQNWRPEGRMRGALSGQAYADALNQYILRPNQQAQVARPGSNGSSSITDITPPQHTQNPPGLGNGPGSLGFRPN